MDQDSWKDHTLQNIIRSYDSLRVRLYSRARLLLLRRRLLDEIAQYLPAAGEVLDVGCGYGLFSLYFAMALPGIHMRGIDLAPRRIEHARRAVRQLAVPDVEFEPADATTWQPRGGLRAATMIDVLHHLPRSAVEGVIATLAGRLEPGCRLIIKDIEPAPWHKMACAWIVDRLAHPRSPLHYWPPCELRKLLESQGLCVYKHRMSDFWPCTQVLYVAVKPLS
jgi:2-polyprenyl-3-methyl-5-hydroxy-6-metoxy-1,4-benzoquinol methylase